MKISAFARVAAIGAVATLALAGCAANEPDAPAPTTSESSSAEPTTPALEGTISATGASSQANAQEAWQAGFQTANPGVTVNYEPTGSGTGRTNFQTGASEFIGSDRAFKVDEIAGGFEMCATPEIVEVPLYISPVAVAFNLDGIETLNLDSETIAKIFAGQITNWNDPAIAAHNDGVSLPDQAISPVHRSDKSGTQGTFTAYLVSAAPEVWTWEDADEWPTDLAGEGAQGTSGVKAAISGGAGTIGFLDASQADGLGQVHIEVAGGYVAYSAEAASALVENSPLEDGRTAGDLVFDVDPASAPAGAYPIALVSYLVACEQYEDENIGNLVREYFLHMASEEGQAAAAANAGNAPISAGLRDKAVAAINLIQG